MLGWRVQRKRELEKSKLTMTVYNAAVAVRYPPTAGPLIGSLNRRPLIGWELALYIDNSSDD